MKPAKPSSTTPSQPRQADSPPDTSQGANDTVTGNRRPPRDRSQDPPQPTGTERLKQIGRMMRGEDDDAPNLVDDQDDQDDGEQPRVNGKAPREVKSLLDVSKALGIPVEDLYNLEVPLRVASGDRKTIKLSELKDYHDAEDDHKLDRIAWSEEREREHADIARSRAELSELIAMVPEDKLKPEVLNAIRARHEGMINLERQKTLRRIPDWHDEDRRRGDLEGIAEHLADYGFSANALQGIHDHRMLAYMRDNWLRKQRLSAALEKVKTVRTETPSRSRPATRTQPGAVRATHQPRELDRQVSEVAKLLRGST